MNGKDIRLAKILPFPGRKGCIVPVDHGATYGAISGIEKCYKTIENVRSGGGTAIVLHKGMLARISQYPALLDANYIMHVSASTSFGKTQSEKVLVGTVEEAIRLGAVGVSVHVNLGVDKEPEMLRDFGIISEKCSEWGMPLLSMMYVTGAGNNVTGIAHAARLAQELGSDLVKVDYPGSAEGMKQVINGVDIPVLIAGGSRINELEDFLRVVDEAVFGGASGVSIGRNIFQHKQTKRVTEAICNLLQEKWHLEECINYVNQTSFRVLH
jgi:predicted phospho-2-dehydro-3-deoxyheptonate aldolase